MDILHHSAIGVIGLTIAVASNENIAGVLFLVGSIIADLDAFLVLFGRSFYLKNHQGFSHSLLLIPLYSIVIILALSYWLDFSWINFFALLLGWMIHSLLDYSNTYGIALFYPISKKRYALDAIFFVDTTMLILTALMLYFQFALWLYLSLFLLYIIIKKVMQMVVKKRLGATIVIPSAFNPFDFLVYQNAEEISTYNYNAFSKKIDNKKHYTKQDKLSHHLTDKSQLFQEILQVTKALHIVSVSQENGTLTIIAKDLALRNFGGKFATTTLRFNKDEELIDENSNI